MCWLKRALYECLTIRLIRSSLDVLLPYAQEALACSRQESDAARKLLCDGSRLVALSVAGAAAERYGYGPQNDAKLRAVKHPESARKWTKMSRTCPRSQNAPLIDAGRGERRESLERTHSGRKFCGNVPNEFSKNYTICGRESRSVRYSPCPGKGPYEAQGTGESLITHKLRNVLENKQKLNE